MHVGELIRAARQARGIKLRAAAEKAKISPTYLSRMENGFDLHPSLEVIERIAAAIDAMDELDRWCAAAHRWPRDVDAFFEREPELRMRVIAFVRSAARADV